MHQGRPTCIDILHCHVYSLTVPIPTFDDAPAPRRLLRDVVFEKMLAAIVDGTLEPGERLNDDQLASWLQVSRTPIREAITQLAGYGLVEIEANRYTRVASLDDALYVEASQFLAGLHTLGEQWGLGSLDADAKSRIVRDLDALGESLAAHDLDAPKRLLDIRGEMTAASGNALLAAAEEPLRIRVQFLSPRDEAGHEWQALAKDAKDLRAAVAA